MVLFGSAVWLFAAGILQASTGALWDTIEFLGITIMTTAWFVYAVQYAGHRLNRGTWILLGIVPLTTLALVATNNHHNLFWSYAEAAQPGRVPVQEFRLVFRLFVIYCGLLVLGGAFLLMRLLRFSQGMYRWQGRAVSIAALFPLVVVAAEFLFDYRPLAPLEITPLALTLSTWFVAWTITRFRRRDILSTSHQTVLEKMRDPVVVIDAQYRVVDVNAATRELFVQEPLELDQGSLKKVWPALDAYLQHGTPDGVSADLELHIGGNTRLYDVLISPMTDSRGRVMSSVVVLRDLTERRMAEEALRRNAEQLARSNRELQELADMLPQIVCESDNRGNLVFVNRNAYSTFGYSEQEFRQGLNILQMIATHDRDRAEQNMRRVLNGEDMRGGEYTAVRKDGTTFPIVVYSDRIMREQQPDGMRSIVIDISDRKRTEAELQRVQRLESVGVLAGGIAHDFNNILTAIMGSVSLARAEAQTEQEGTQALSDAEEACHQARRLTHQLLTFAKGGEPIRQPTVLDDLLRKSSALASSGSKVRCEHTIPIQLWPVEIDAGQMSQVVHNLIINAVQAMPQGGVVQVSAQNVSITEHDGLPLSEGNYVKIGVRDYGVGIRAEHLHQVFDPYFSTKDDGSGLGLAISHSIVNKHDGLITVESRIEAGTVFCVYLPASEKEPEKFWLTEVETQAGCGKILVMDDEDIVRRTASLVLEHAGYEVHQVRDGEEAIAAYKSAKQTGSPFTLAILDLTVRGGLGGKDCLEQLRRIDPNVRAVVSSGYSNDPVMSDFRRYGFVGVIPKPFDRDELLKAVRRASA